MKEYLEEEYGIYTMEDLKKAIEEMPKINLALFTGKPIEEDGDERTDPI